MKNKLGTRNNKEKLKWSYVDFKSLEPLVEVLMFGAKKYKPYNWKKGLKYTEVCESLLRHTYSFLNSDNKDKESKLDHTGHILANAMFLSYMYQNRKDLDDRFKIKKLLKNDTNKRRNKHNNRKIKSNKKSIKR